MRKLIALLCALSMCACTFAADEEARDTAGAAAGQEMELDAALKPLSYFIGVWRVEKQIMPSQFSKGGAAQGKMVIQPDLQGKALMGRMEGDGPEGHMEALNVCMAEEGKPNQYAMFCADSMGNMQITHDARLEQNRFTFESVHKHGDKSFPVRITDTKVDNNRIDFVVEAKTEKGWERVAMGKYTRMAQAGQPVKFHEEAKEK
jgi:hypothetical protein